MYKVEINLIDRRIVLNVQKTIIDLRTESCFTEELHVLKIDIHGFPTIENDFRGFPNN